MKRIGYLGPPGTFSELAARFYLDRLKKVGNYEESTVVVCLSSFSDILSAVESGELEEGLLPFENSTEGPINIILDLLAHRFKNIKIKEEAIIPVVHQLLARQSFSPDELEVIVSHPQALAQCRGFIERYLNRAQKKEVISTAEAARLVSLNQGPWAAIGTTLVAETYNLIVLAENVNDYPENATRFVVIALQDSKPVPGCKTSLILSVNDRPGALFDILKEFAKRQINLTHIESRPTKSRLGDYLFFIDFEGHREDAHVRDSLSYIRDYTVSMRILGSYPAHDAAKRRENS